MENLTHSLVGATLAELALPNGASREQRRAFFVTGVLAANLPDADLVYTWITPAPLGSLLHHRGHTHTLGGLVALALLFGVAAMLPSVQRTIAPMRGRWWLLVAVGLVSHLVLDSWNSYGVHPFWPFDARWIYGDAIFIADPWLWLLLGISAALNTQRRGGGATLGIMLGLIVAVATWRGVIPPAGAVALCAGAIAFVAMARRWMPRRRAAVATTIAALYVMAMFGARERVKSSVLADRATDARGRVVDLVLSPEPANPLCWSVLSIVADESRNQYETTRGTASVIGTGGCGPRDTRQAWETPVAQSLGALRDLNARDCWVRAWLQFGRAPEMAPGVIYDRRYGGATGNFSSMAVGDAAARSGCPAHLTSWRPPRADLLTAGAE